VPNAPTATASTPDTPDGSWVDARSTPTTVEILHKSQRVASHLRAHGHGKLTEIEVFQRITMTFQNPSF